jgi:hypothetical protein
MVVVDVIHDPMMVDKTKLSHYQHDLGVSNIDYAAVAPRNSIIARPVMQPGAGASEKTMVLYPFFPPHLALPSKPGEHVWAMFEHPDAQVNEIGYWMCRIVGPDFVEDVNYTHMDRQFDKSFLPGLSDVFAGSDDPIYEFRNGAVDNKNGTRFTIPETASLPDGEDAYKQLLTDSDASQITRYESVPRYRKRPADIAFEGSNNTLLVMGTDRSGPASDYTTDSNNGQVPKPHTADIFADGAGMVDIVAGRGQTPATGGTPEDNKIVGKELGKSRKDLSAQEGDVDYVNDRSRVLISQKTKVDTNFKINAIVSAHSTQKQISDGSGEGAIVIKTDKIRIVARHDVVFLVTGVTATDGAGNAQDTSNPDPTKCASIILRTNGDIIFTPSSSGLIRLGGDDATLSPLCTRVGNAPGMSGPLQPSAISPIVDTMGGIQGQADGLNGTFPSKVLMK